MKRFAQFAGPLVVGLLLLAGPRGAVAEINCMTDHCSFSAHQIQGLRDTFSNVYNSDSLRITNVYEISDDFFTQTLTEANGPWIENSGGDAQAVDPAAAVEEYGAVTLVTGDADGAVANDGSQIISAYAMNANNGNMVFEARLHIDTAVTTVSVCAGFTDNTSLEEPAEVGSSDAITTDASDAVVLCYDTGADTDEWFFIGVANDTDATGNGATGISPTADTYQVLRIEVDADGGGALAYIDGVLAGELTANAVTATDAIYATVIANATTTTSKSVDIDYIYAATDR